MRDEKKVALFKLKTQLYTLHENRFLVHLKVVYIESAREKMTNVLFFCTIQYLTRVSTE